MLSKRILPLAALCLAVVLVYANSFGNSFHFDDFHAITDNPAVRSLRNLPCIFTDATAFSVLPANQTYRPVVTASLALDYALGHGYVPWAFHLSTMIWFLVLLGLLFLLAERVFDAVEPSPANRWLALGLAAWFGLHPAMAETVNYAIQRGDLYCTLGCVAALYGYAAWPRLRRYGLYLLPLVLALLSKPPAAVFPVLLALYVFFFEAASLPPARRWRASLVAALPALAVTGALLLLQSAMTPKSFLPSIVSPADYRLTQPFVWLRYFGALFLPLHLNVDTDLQPMPSLTLAAVAGLVFACGLLVSIAFTARRRRLYPIAYGLLWFLLTQLPTSLYPLSEVENDHRMFFSFPGLMLALVWALRLGYERLRQATGGDALTSRRWRAAAEVAAVLALCAYAHGTVLRNRVWRSEATLWADDVAKSPRNGRGLMIYGLTRMNEGDYSGALQLFTRALQYTPNYATLEINLGVVNGLLAARGEAARLLLAETHFQRAVALAPADDTTHAYYGRWLLGQNRLPEATGQLEAAVSLNGQREMQRSLLLAAYDRAGNTAAARALAQQTLAIVPGNAPALAVLRGQPLEAAGQPGNPIAAAYINASLAAYQAGRFEESIAKAKQALAVDPQSAEAWNNVGAGYGALHQWKPAVDAEQRALELNPQLQIAQNNLRWFMAQRRDTSPDRGPDPVSVAAKKSAAEFVDLSLELNKAGRYAESLDAARHALQVDPNSAEAWNNIAADEEAQGHWDAAIAAAQRAIALKPAFQLAKNNLAWSLGQKAAAEARR